MKNTNINSYFLNSTFIKQLIWIAFSSVIFFIIQWLRIQFLHEYAYHLYLLIILLIISTLFMPIIGGSRRWIILGGLSFQPSEVGKLVLVFTLARFISDFQSKISDIYLIKDTF